jgi:hypothetical protein
LGRTTGSYFKNLGEIGRCSGWIRGLNDPDVNRFSEIPYGVNDIVTNGETKVFLLVIVTV